jgi:hypothetical protein
MGSERSLQPQRDRITEMQLKEQAARLNQEQFAEALAATGADEGGAGQKLDPDLKPQYLQGEVTRLTNAIRRSARSTWRRSRNWPRRASASASSMRRTPT